MHDTPSHDAPQVRTEPLQFRFITGPDPTPGDHKSGRIEQQPLPDHSARHNIPEPN
ncbi:hypothetical protein GGR01_001709 [Acetobacter oeni]|nr:hypothetical protein [Acetobacter oeni]